MGTGTPANGGRSSSPARASAVRVAALRASSSLRQITALRVGLSLSTWSRHCSRSSTGLISRRRIAAASSVAGVNVSTPAPYGTVRGPVRACWPAHRSLAGRHRLSPGTGPIRVSGGSRPEAVVRGHRLREHDGRIDWARRASPCWVRRAWSQRGRSVPLSEHEQRILAELEESLVRQDPEFAERVRSETVYRHAGRYCKWAAVTFVIGVVILVAFYSKSVPAGFVGVVIMFASAVWFERNLRRMGRAGWHDIRRAKDGEAARDGAEPTGIEGAVSDARDW